MGCSLPRVLLSMVFPRQKYWSGLSFPSPGDLPDPGIKPRSPALQVDCLPSKLPGSPDSLVKTNKKTMARNVISKHDGENKKLGPRALLLGAGTGDHALNLALSGKSTTLLAHSSAIASFHSFCPTSPLKPFCVP